MGASACGLLDALVQFVSAASQRTFAGYEVNGAGESLVPSDETRSVRVARASSSSRSLPTQRTDSFARVSAV